jgi:hypothetical protein
VAADALREIASVIRIHPSLRVIPNPLVIRGTLLYC